MLKTHIALFTALSILVLTLVACSAPTTTSTPYTSQPSTPTTTAPETDTTTPDSDGGTNSGGSTDSDIDSAPETDITTPDSDGGTNSGGSTDSDIDSGNGGDTGDSATGTELVRLQLVSGEARFRVMEVLVSGLRKVDVLGTTRQVGGDIFFDANGTLDTQRSLWTVNVDSLTTDENKRNNYLRSQALQTNLFPDAIYTFSSIEGLQWPLPQSGTHSLTLNGQMQLHGVTSEQTWEATATFSPTQINVTAQTRTTFGKYGMSVPRLFFLVSVEDDIRLELELVLSVGTG